MIQAETNNSFEMCLRPDAESEKILGTAIANYREVNKKKWILQKNFTLSLPYEIIGSSKIAAILKGVNWDKFYRQYPNSGGLLKFSAIGFNQDKTVAVVFQSLSCGGLCGRGQYHVMQKKDGK